MNIVSFIFCFFFFSSRRRHTRWTGDWSSDVCSSDLPQPRQYRRTGGRLVAEDGDPAGSGRDQPHERSEERRVGKECRSRGSPDHLKKKKKERVSVWGAGRGS